MVCEDRPCHEEGLLTPGIVCIDGPKDAVVPFSKEPQGRMIFLGNMEVQILESIGRSQGLYPREKASTDSPALVKRHNGNGNHLSPDWQDPGPSQDLQHGKPAYFFLDLGDEGRDLWIKESFGENGIIGPKDRKDLPGEGLDKG